MYRIERITTEAQFAALRGPWAELLGAEKLGAFPPSGVETAGLPALGPRPVFLTWEWVVTWCRHLEPNWEPWVLAVWDSAPLGPAAPGAAGRLAGLAPWMLVHHSYGPLRIKRLAFMGSQYAYRTHQDILLRPGEAGPVLDALFDYLKTQRRQWDVLDLEGLAEASPLKAYLQAKRVAGGHFVEKEAIECPYAPLPDTWAAYEMEQLSANRRQQIRARRRHLERDFPGQVRFETVSDPAALPGAMDAMIELHRKRWHGRGQASSFDVPSFLDFHRDVAATALECGWLRLYLLKLGDRAIAAEYCYLHDGVLFDYQKAIDPDPALERYSPGQLVQAYALQEAIKEGAREFDMARGTYDYKFSWTNKSRPDWHVAFSGTPAGRLWLDGGRLVAAGKVKSREILPDSLRQRINRALSGPRPADNAR